MLVIMSCRKVENSKKCVQSVQMCPPPTNHPQITRPHGVSKFPNVSTTRKSRDFTEFTEAHVASLRYVRECPSFTSRLVRSSQRLRPRISVRFTEVLEVCNKFHRGCVRGFLWGVLGHEMFLWHENTRVCRWKKLLETFHQNVCDKSFPKN